MTTYTTALGYLKKQGWLVFKYDHDDKERVYAVQELFKEQCRLSLGITDKLVKMRVWEPHANGELYCGDLRVLKGVIKASNNDKKYKKAQ